MEKQSLLELQECSDGESTTQHSCCQKKQRHNNLERKLYFILLGSFILAFVIAAVFGFMYQTEKVTWKYNVLVTPNAGSFTSKSLDSHSVASNLCLTSGCVKAAARILSNINESVDPCTDFFQFACGGWINQHPIPGNKGSISFFSLSQHELDLQLKELLERKLSGSEQHFVLILKNMYESCMDLNSIEKRNSEPLKRVLKMLGGWPVVEGSNWNQPAFDWIETLKSLRNLGYNHRMLINLSVDVDRKNSSSHIITLSQAELGMPDRTYLIHGLNDSSTAAYFNVMLNMVKRLGADEVISKDELMKSLNFEIALANISLPREAFRDLNKTYNRYTVRELQQLIPQVPWLKYLNSLLVDEIFEDEPLIVIDLDFAIKFGELISTTGKRVIANYMLWRVIFESLSSLGVEWRNILHEISTAFTGKTQQEFRWEACLLTLKGYLRIALSSYYVRNYFDEESKEASLKLYKYIQKEFLENLEEIDWMEKETKKGAKEKIEAIKVYSGYPDELLNDTLIERIYRNLTIRNDSFFDNVLSLKKWSTDITFSSLRNPYVKRQWTQHSNAVVVNSFYKSLENSIEFLAGILRKGFFDKNRPHYMNFGAIGFVLAHELTHSLDDVGRQFDKDGSNINWWDKKTEKNFKKKAQCIIDQFSNLTSENGMKLNGVNTQGENIADNGGFKLAFKAYQSWIRDNGPDQKLPGLKYSPSQLFWISTTNIWCGKFRSEALKLRILTGTHVPDHFRIIGGLSNLAEFSEEFNCSSHTGMNPKNKCMIW